jgi:sugar-specific transcriptional regulator TrmB
VSDGKPFIPRWLDGAELSVQEFRVLAHLWSHKVGYCPAAPAIARICRINKDSVWSILTRLENRGLVERQKGFRNSNTYRLIIPDVGGNGGVAQDDESAEIRGRVSAEMEGLHPAEIRGRVSAEMEGCKGNTIEELNPRKQNEDLFADSGESSLPAKLSKQSAQSSAESIYQKYPKKVGKATAITAILKALKSHSEAFLAERTEAYAKAISWQKRQYIPNP